MSTLEEARTEYDRRVAEERLRMKEHTERLQNDMKFEQEERERARKIEEETLLQVISCCYPNSPSSISGNLFVAHVSRRNFITLKSRKPG